MFKPKYTLISIFFLFTNSIYSQLSELKRFWVNSDVGCHPFEVVIIKENVGPNVSVIQYDFNYSKTTGIFSPSSGKTHKYKSPGKYTIAQAINQDGVEKIDFVDVNIYEPKKIEVEIFNCKSNELQININDDYYDLFTLYFKNKSQSNPSFIEIQELIKGKNTVNYSNFLLPENKLEGYIIGGFNTSDGGKNFDGCYQYPIDIIAIDEGFEFKIDSIKLSNDLLKIDLFYNPNKSSNYNIILDGKMDSSYLTSALIKPDDKIINLSNDFFFKCLELEKIDYCDSSSERDKICLIYLNNVSKTDGHLLEWNYDTDFDSLLIFKNDKIINSMVDKSSSMLDNQEIILGENYCYFIKGFIEGKASISNTICIDADKNYNPLPIPNAFTPNSDGLNDYFLPVKKEVKDYKIYIFNRFGELVFESNDIEVGWDGNYKNKIFQDTYFYKIEFNKNGKLITQTGKFVLIK